MLILLPLWASFGAVDNTSEPLKVESRYGFQVREPFSASPTKICSQLVHAEDMCAHFACPHAGFPAQLSLPTNGAFAVEAYGGNTFVTVQKTAPLCAAPFHIRCNNETIGSTCAHLVFAHAGFPAHLSLPTNGAFAVEAYGGNTFVAVQKTAPHCAGVLRLFIFAAILRPLVQSATI